ncbi:MAG TPA: hypothetical protein VGL89_04080 [Candidatus Koribacter sp.]|jgi:hypothetical protein
MDIHHDAQIEDWIFPDSPHTNSFTIRDIMDRKLPIIRVFHDKDDGAWQFHGAQESRLEDAILVCLHCVVGIDPSLNELADLPLGWCAWREDPAFPWNREPYDPDSEDE